MKEIGTLHNFLQCLKQSRISTSLVCTSFIQFSLFSRTRRLQLFMSLLPTEATTEGFSPSRLLRKATVEKSF